MINNHTKANQITQILKQTLDNKNRGLWTKSK